MNDNDVKRLRTALGLSQSGLSKGSGVHKATLSRIESAEQGASPSVAVKLASATGGKIDAGVIYGMTQVRAILRAVEEEEIDAPTAGNRLLKVLSTLMERFPTVESAEGGSDLLDILEAALEENTGKSVEGVRGEKGAAVAKKSRNAHPLILRAIDHVGTGATDPSDYETNDGRDALGRKVKLLPEDYGDELDSGNLSLEDERGFEDVGSFGTSNEPVDYDDNYPTDAYGDGRDLFGRRNRPMERS